MVKIATSHFARAFTDWSLSIIWSSTTLTHTHRPWFSRLSPSLALALGFGSFLYSLPRSACAQELPPKGIGAWQLGYRSYSPQDQYFNEAGVLTPQGSRFDVDFSGKNMLAGKSGPALKELASELKKFAGQNPDDASLVYDLSLGQLKGAVKAEISAYVIGAAYGIRNDLSAFFGVPIVSARVQTSLAFSGQNNALEIKERLGGLAFDELAEGLEKAAAISTTDILNSMKDAGYADISDWQKTGVGDLRLGINTVFARRSFGNAHLRLLGTTQLEVPTGYTEQPDLLTDVSFGKGTFTPTAGGDARLTFYRLPLGASFYMGTGASLSNGIPIKITKRVPEAGESIIKKERTADVWFYPGFEPAANLTTGANLGPWGASYSFLWRHHFADRYSGKLTGDYDSMSDATNTLEMAHEAAINFSTVSWYRRKMFPVPFILSAMAHLPSTAYNLNNNQFYMLTFTSFFSTPAAAPEAPRRTRLLPHKSSPQPR
jgi:hypothetical protein